MLDALLGVPGYHFVWAIHILCIEGAEFEYFTLLPLPTVTLTLQG